MGRAAASGKEVCRYRCVRWQRWGKWVSEIRVPGTRERLWLGSYATAKAAAVAHDAAVCLLRGQRTIAAGSGLNFPGLSPRSVQHMASDAGMAIDAQLVDLRHEHPFAPAPAPGQPAASSSSCSGGVAGDGAGKQGTHGKASATDWCSHAEDRSRSWSSGSEQLIVYGDLSVDDMEILM